MIVMPRHRLAALLVLAAIWVAAPAFSGLRSADPNSSRLMYDAREWNASHVADQLAHEPSKQAFLGASTPELVRTGGYDDRLQLVRTSAPPGDYRSAPQTAGVLRNKAVGDAGADAIAARYPGAMREVTLQAESGIRRLDVLTPEGLAIESKVGRTSLTAATRQQIARHAELLNDPFSPVSSVEWHFLRSPTTGRYGPTAPLLEALEKAGIRAVG
jgi:hypothetical protein